MVTSLAWSSDGNYLSIGANNSNVHLWQVEAKKQLRTMRGHSARVGALAWNNHVLSTGSRDSMIFNHDVRIAQHKIASLKGHSLEICGLKWYGLSPPLSLSIYLSISLSLSLSHTHTHTHIHTHSLTPLCFL